MVQNFFGRVRMIKGQTKLSAADKSLRELAGELFHLAQRRKLRHFLPAHFEKFEKHMLLFIERRLIRLASGDDIRELAEYPGILHRAASDEDPVGSRFTPSSQTIFDRRDVAVAGDRNGHRLFHLSDQVP